MKLLVINDGDDFGSWLSARLAKCGFSPIQAGSPETALREGQLLSTAAVLLDLGKADERGPAVIEALRAQGLEQPLVALCSRREWQFAVDCLDAGADDYLVKPVHSQEVAARLRAAVRRVGGSSTSLIAAGEFELDIRGSCAWQDGRCLMLTRNEFRLLQLLLLHGNRVMSQQTIHEFLRGDDESFSANAIEVLVARLRRKIGRDRIRTLRGVGYRFDPGVGSERHEREPCGRSISRSRSGTQALPREMRQ